MLGGSAQGQLAEHIQVALAEEVGQRLLDFFGSVYFALTQAGAQLVHSHVHVHHFVGTLEKAVGDGLADDSVGGAVDGVVERFQVLDVDRGHHVDAGVEQFQNILVTLAILAAGNIGVGQLVHNDGLRMAGQEGVHVHFFQGDAAVGNLALGHDLQVTYAGRGLLAPVSFHQANHHIHALLILHPVSIVEHVIGLAHSRRGSDVYAKPGGFLLSLQFDLCHGSALLDGITDFVDDRHGKREAECGSVSQAALDGDLAAHLLDQAADQREAESGILL